MISLRPRRILAARPLMNAAAQAAHGLQETCELSRLGAGGRDILVFYGTTAFPEMKAPAPVARCVMSLKAIVTISAYPDIC